LVSRYLITTANKDTWQSDKPKLLLGKWCQTYNESERKVKQNYEIVPYHWNDRRQLHNDYQYLIGDLYERLLEHVTEALNKIHCVDYSVRYWRIFVGPWLGYFLMTSYDRWQMINKALNCYQVSATCKLDLDDDFSIPLHQNQFQKQITDDLWNHWFYVKILEWLKYDSFDLTESASCYNICKDEKKSFKSSLFRLGKTIFKKSVYLGNCFSINNDFFLISSYLNPLDQAKLEISLGQFPTSMESPNLAGIKVNKKLREQLDLGFFCENNFEKFVSSMIPNLIPRYYIEGYDVLKKSVKNINWPVAPKIIFTSNAVIANDFFKLWSSEKVENGAKLLLGQHGGGYGAMRFNFNELHETSVSDKYITWGWQENDSTLPLPASKLSGVQYGYNPTGSLLMVCMTLPKYSYRLYSVPIASQVEDYINDQLDFVDYLDKDVKNNLVVRLYPSDRDWKQKQRWEDRYSAVQFDSPKNTMKSSINDSRLFIGTYNSTTILEVMAFNIPVIMYWNPEHWELRESAEIEYEKLRKVGILHDNPKSAADKVNSIWADVDSWWMEEIVQEAVKDFCHKFARTSPDYLEQWKDTLKLVAKPVDPYFDS
jgi:putative transferase (TIGR04331 family)